MTIESYLYLNPEEVIDGKRLRDRRLAEHEAKIREIRRLQASRRHKKQVRDAISGKSKRGA